MYTKMIMLTGQRDLASSQEQAAKQQGFSLLELMIVVTIIGVIGAIIIPFAGSNKTKATTLLTSMKSLGDGAMLLQQDGGCYPNLLRALTARNYAATSFCGVNMSSNWRGPYVKEATFNGPGNALLDTVATGIQISIVRDATGGNIRYGIHAEDVPAEILSEAANQCNKAATSTNCTVRPGTGGAPGQITRWFDSANS